MTNAHSASRTQRPVAFLTGASRGIGRATALRLANAGFDLILTGRSVHSPKSHGGHMLSGTLNDLAQEAQSAGAATCIAALDLLDGASIDQAVVDGLATFGRIDVVVHSATYTTVAMQDEVLTLPLDALEESLRANVIGSTRLAQRVLPAMIEQESGVWISLVSGASVLDPPHRAREGGWGFLYGAQKAALYRLAGVLNTEYGDHGIRAYNLQPGIVSTEILRASLGTDGPLEKDWGIAPPEIPAAAVLWLIEEDLAGERLGRGVHAQKLAKELNLA